jgi:hypothetical protein
MSELVEFLRARLGEDEQAARMRRGTYPRPEDGDWAWTNIKHAGSALIVKADRVLREVEARRKMLDELYPEVKGADESIEGEWNSNPYNADTLLELLALPYADHPDYREEWKP